MLITRKSFFRPDTWLSLAYAYVRQPRSREDPDRLAVLLAVQQVRQRPEDCHVVDLHEQLVDEVADDSLGDSRVPPQGR